MNNVVDEFNMKKRVVIGLSGGTSSLAAAYLLKIQKFELIAVTLLQNSNPETKCRVSEEDLKRIKDFCFRLGIPHHTVDMEGAFTEKVQNRWISSKLEKRSWPVSCLSCHEMRMELLYQKMIELNATHLSTGHFAKLFHGEDAVSVHSVHDLSLDQSLILQKLDQKILSALLLPLASLGASEIAKLIENFSLPQMRASITECFSGSHSQKELERFSLFNIPDGVSRDEESGQLRLLDVVWSAGEHSLTPFTAYINFSDKSIKVQVYPKTLGTILLELSEPLHLSELTELALYKKKGGNAKLILSGRVKYYGVNEAKQSDSLRFVF